jgi:hypothetical protein
MDIQGLWAAGVFYYDAFEETYIGISNTGFGFIYYMTPYSDQIELFNWKSSSEADITIIGIKIYTFYRDGLSEIEDSDINLVNLKVKKYSKKKFSGEKIETIEFSKPISIGDSVFGLEDKDISNCHKYNRIKKLLGEHLPIEFNNL